MTNKNNNKNLEYKICPYYVTLLEGGTTFENPNEILQRCYECNGYGVYFDKEGRKKVCDWYRENGRYF